MSDKLVTSGAMKRLIDKTKPILDDHETRLDNIENVEPSTAILDQPLNKIENVENMVEMTSVEGNTLQNLLTEPEKINATELTSAPILFGDVKMLKPNTTYTFIYDLLSSTVVNNGNITLNFKSGGGKPDIALSLANPGINKITFTLTDDMYFPEYRIGAYIWSEYYDAGNRAVISNPMILEGDWTTYEGYIPYVEGIKSVDNIEMKSVGKNLFDNKKFLTDVTNQYYYYEENGKLFAKLLDTRSAGFDYSIYLQKGTYTLSTTTTPVQIRAYASDSGNFSSHASIKMAYTSATEFKQSHTFTLAKDFYIAFKFIRTDSAITHPFEIGNIQLERNDIATDYESYIETPYNIILNEPLRKIQNKFFTKTDIIDDQKIIRNIKKIVLNGSETIWTNHNSNDNYISFYLDPSKFGINAVGLCDKFDIETWSTLGNVIPINKEILWSNCPTSFGISIAKSKLTTADKNGFLKWLSENPVTVYGQLIEPIIEEIEYNEILTTYPNGNILIEGLILPTIDVEYQTGFGGKIAMIENELTENRERIFKLETELYTPEDVKNYWNN